MLVQDVRSLYLAGRHLLLSGRQRVLVSDFSSLRARLPAGRVRAHLSDEPEHRVYLRHELSGVETVYCRVRVIDGRKRVACDIVVPPEEARRREEEARELGVLVERLRPGG